MLERQLIADPTIGGDPLAQRLIPVLVAETGTTSAGWPYLQQPAFEAFRDRVPHILGMGPQVSACLARIRERAEQLSFEAVDPEALVSFEQAARVVQQMLKTAAVTAPPTLWLLRHVGHSLHLVGIAQRLLAGEAVDTDNAVDAAGHTLVAAELQTDLALLQVLGLLTRQGSRFSLSAHPRAARVLSSLEDVPGPPDIALRWQRAFQGDPVDTALLVAQAEGIATRTSLQQDTWMPTAGEVHLGARLLPLVLGLASAQRLEAFEGDIVRPDELSVTVGAAALQILQAAGVLVRRTDGYATTSLGRRVLARGPGPFGIIGTYHPYLAKLPEILREGRAAAHVTRGANIAASQRANRTSFKGANDALDVFCADTGFSYQVFIEHALGRGEATRQRWLRSKGPLTWVGADLEDAAIDAAEQEQAIGNLPEGMVFVRGADIGRPETLLRPLHQHGIDTEGAVMLVGNGFHEVRDPSDRSMIRVFETWCRAGIVLLFTEETALSIGDQLSTAWNTYHHGFRYVHEKSGQGLRPADAAERRADSELPMSWSECAQRAGYVVLDRYTRRGRTIFPHPTPDGRNPTTSVSYFAVPRALAERLGL